MVRNASMGAGVSGGRQMRVVMLGEEQREALKKAMEFAKAHPFNPSQLKTMCRRESCTHAKEHYVSIPVGISVGFTYEFQGPMGKVPLWHVSFQIDLAGRVIHPIAASLILQACGLPAADKALDCRTIHGAVNLWFADGLTQEELARIFEEAK